MQSEEVRDQLRSIVETLQGEYGDLARQGRGLREEEEARLKALSTAMEHLRQAMGALGVEIGSA